MRRPAGSPEAPRDGVLAWVRQGDAPGSSPEVVEVTGDIIGFAGGYVARHQGPGVYFSPDGRAWQSILLPPLDIEGAHEPYIAALASSGAQVLAAANAGDLTIASTPVSEFECPVIPLHG